MQAQELVIYRWLDTRMLKALKKVVQLAEKSCQGQSLHSALVVPRTDGAPAE